MKNLLILLTMAFIVISCSQNNCSNGQLDSGETSIDCGGNCPPCPITNPNTTPNQSTTLQDIQGLWDLIGHTQLESNISGGGTKESLAFTRGTNCKIDLTSNNPMIVGNNTYYDGYGGLGVGCSYPTVQPYYYDSGTNLITNNWFVDFVNNDTMILSQANMFILYYQKAPTTWGSNATVDWEVTLTSAYTGSVNEVEIRLNVNNIFPSVSIPIVPNQLTYSGTLNVNLQSSSPFVQVTLFDLTYPGSGLTNPNIIQFSTKLKCNGYEAISGEHATCVGSSVTSCQGYDALSQSFLTGAMILWQ